MLASRRLIREAHAWWLSIGDLEIHKDVWMNFRALITLRYGTLPGEGLPMHYGDPDIYSDMYMRRYVSYVAVWHAYPNESMGHYCQRFRDIMLPYIPQDRPLIHALHIFRSRLPPEIMQFTSPATTEMTLDEIVDAIMGAEDDHRLIPVDDAGIRKLVYHEELLLAPVAPAGAQANMPMILEDLLYERFRRMKAPEFEGPTNPIEADNWLIDIQVILDFMGHTEHEMVLCASFVLKKDARYWWMIV
ncbi:hypothetical protein TIFTF001_034254 [Ficus carica]|uniref:Retrotransposon gag domain-containing protein n=1 Tax=Ficus carica TaxID=3494 RepID=A0AA88DZG7_FICCA|nr:hypothetical protein TIFTF001_034254 [Ficus carica]